MVDSIYVKNGSNLIPMVSQPYDSEDLLQGLLASHPDLLAGDQIGSGAPRRWLLVAREAGVPGEVGAQGRWSVDHLFLDQDGVPTLVEVKRSSDTRIRREVVGQMLDYAANAVAYWPIEQVRASLKARLNGGETTEEDAVLNLLDGEGNPEEFWRTVKTNLQAGRIRMLFVADVIPPELRRIVEFLNGQMDPAEILAVEVRQYVGQDMQALVPRVIGQTAEAQRKKGSSTGGPSPLTPLFREIARRWNAGGHRLRAKEDNRAQRFLQLTVGHGEMHYEWILRTSEKRLGVGLHFEAADRDLNFARMERVREFARQAAEEAGVDHEAKPFGRQWAAVELYVSCEDLTDKDLADRTARVMGILVRHTLGEVEAMAKAG